MGCSSNLRFLYIGSVGFKKEIEGLVCVVGGLRLVWVIVENLSFSHILVLYGLSTAIGSLISIKIYVPPISMVSADLTSKPNTRGTSLSEC